MEELIYKELSYAINGILFEVQNKLGTKFQEKHYIRAVCALLNKITIPYQLEVPITVTFEGMILGKFRADMVVDNKIIIEFKTTNYLTQDHKKQMIRYLDAMDIKLGLLVNFRIRPLTIWRIIKSRQH